MNKHKFVSFQSLRLFAFLVIFMLHAGKYRIVPFEDSGRYAVVFFIMLSGFLYGFYRNNYQLKDFYLFIKKKILKIWPLYLLSIIMIIPLTGIFQTDFSFQALWPWCTKLFLNVFMLQSWIPNFGVVYSFNYVGWFISVYIFLILLTLPILTIIQKIAYNKKSIIICMVMTFLFFILYEHVIELFRFDALYWLFTFPPSRIFEYVFAILLGMFTNLIFKDMSNKKISTFWYTVFEIISIIFLVITIFIIDSHEYWSMTIGWIIPITFILFVFLGNMTFEAFLFHEVIDRYVYMIPNINNGLTYIKIIFIFFYILIITFIISYLLHQFAVLKKESKG